jgi:hypothetical protein
MLTSPIKPQAKRAVTALQIPAKFHGKTKKLTSRLNNKPLIHNKTTIPRGGSGAREIPRYNRGMTRPVLSALLICLLASPAFANPVRLERISRIFALDEAAMAYVRHCTDPVQTIRSNPFFMDNAQAVAMALAEELAAEKKITVEQAGDEMMQKREALEAQLDKTYTNKNYCKTDTAAMGFSHFNTFGRTHPDALAEYLSDIENK